MTGTIYDHHGLHEIVWQWRFKRTADQIETREDAWETMFMDRNLEAFEAYIDDVVQPFEVLEPVIAYIRDLSHDQPVLFGETGVGKSYLLAATAHEPHLRGKRVLFVPGTGDAARVAQGR
jgi:DNA replication protein DnaC